MAAYDPYSTSIQAPTDTAPGAVPPRVPALQGYLRKLKSKARFIGSWNKRWFVIQPVSKELVYFRTKGASKAAGAIALDDITCVKRFDTMQFQVEAPARNFFLRADTEEDANRWIATLNAYVGGMSAYRLYLSQQQKARQEYKEQYGHSPPPSHQQKQHTPQQQQPATPTTRSAPTEPAHAPVHAESKTGADAPDDALDDSVGSGAAAASPHDAAPASPSVPYQPSMRSPSVPYQPSMRSESKQPLEAAASESKTTPEPSAPPAGSPARRQAPRARPTMSTPPRARRQAAAPDAEASPATHSRRSGVAARSPAADGDDIALFTFLDDDSDGSSDGEDDAVPVFRHRARSGAGGAGGKRAEGSGAAASTGATTSGVRRGSSRDLRDMYTAPTRRDEFAPLDFSDDDEDDDDDDPFGLVAAARAREEEAARLAAGSKAAEVDWDGGKTGDAAPSGASAASNTPGSDRVSRVSSPTSPDRRSSVGAGAALGVGGEEDSVGADASPDRGQLGAPATPVRPTQRTQRAAHTPGVQADDNWVESDWDEEEDDDEDDVADSKAHEPAPSRAVVTAAAVPSSARHAAAAPHHRNASSLSEVAGVTVDDNFAEDDWDDESGSDAE